MEINPVEMIAVDDDFGGNEPGDEPADDLAGGGMEPVVAAQLHVNDVVRREGALRVVTSVRMQGAPAQVCVELAGLPGRHRYPAAARLNILRRNRSRA